MTTQWRSPVRLLRAVLGIGVVGVVCSTTLLTVAQRFWVDSPWWLELSRYLPYPLFLVPALGALCVSFWLGRLWMLASALNLVLWLTLGMGLQWNRSQGPAETVRVMTYNVKVFNALQQRDDLHAIEREVASYDPDILVMQDADGLLVARSDPGFAQGAVFGLPNVYALGQYVVASRYPLRQCGPGQINFNDQSHRYVRCVVNARGKDLTLVTAHFQSPRAGLVAARREGLDGADDWQRNLADRLTQAVALARDLADVRGALVVAGDLNAPETSPVVRTLLRIGLHDTFSSAGRGYGYTYGHALHRGYDFLRIDHILVSKDIGVTDSFVGQGAASDHRAVIADLILHR